MFSKMIYKAMNQILLVVILKEIPRLNFIKIWLNKLQKKFYIYLQKGIMINNHIKIINAGTANFSIFSNLFFRATIFLKIKNIIDNPITRHNIIKL